MLALAAKSTHGSPSLRLKDRQCHAGLQGIGYRIHILGARYGGVGLWHARCL